VQLDSQRETVCFRLHEIAADYSGVRGRLCAFGVE
jgi:hypothetical protein